MGQHKNYRAFRSNKDQKHFKVSEVNIYFSLSNTFEEIIVNLAYEVYVLLKIYVCFISFFSLVFITTDGYAGLFCSECLREKVGYNQSNFKQETQLNSLEKSRGSGSRLHISISFWCVCPSLMKLCCNTDSL